MKLISNIRQTMDEQISKGMLKDIQNIARKKKRKDIIMLKLNLSCGIN